MIKREIENYIRNSNLEVINKKSQIKSILNQFNKKYGEYMILSVLIELVNDKKLILGQNLFKRIYRKIMFLPK